MAAFATASDMLARFSEQALADLLSDQTRIPAGSIATAPRLLRALDDAAGLIRSAAFAGQRYSETELSALAGAGDTTVVMLNCSLAWMLLMERKSEGGNPIPEFVERANRMLDQLRLGFRIFATPAAPAAGLPKIIEISAAERQRIGLWADNTGFFPPRGSY